MKTVLYNGQIILPDRIIKRGYVEMTAGKISRIVEGDFLGNNDVDAVDVQGDFISPGFIDQHIHGSEGIDFMHASVAQIDVVKQALLREGTTGFLATTTTDSDAIIEQALVKLSGYQGDTKAGARMLGIHLEGPFLAKKYCGAQKVEQIIVADLAKMKRYVKAANGEIKLITYAPENADTAFTKYLVSQKICPSVGHSGASFAQISTHVSAGLRNVTHFHNASSGHDHRNPGVVSAGLYFNELMVEVIADGHHVHPDALKVIYRTKGANNICLITDSVLARGMENGQYNLFGYAVTKTDQTIKLADGTLAGSIIHMNENIRRMMSFSGCLLHEAVKMASYNPAKQIGLLGERGYLAEGLNADIIVFDENITIQRSYMLGQLEYMIKK
ncbi:MAG: N-acetylglucosamine-6-phosphate deacetylase [Culicoidibacterales bacterium]